jgi:hypothetical protein
MPARVTARGEADDEPAFSGDIDGPARVSDGFAPPLFARRCLLAVDDGASPLH